jgi:hypothetical protein
VNTIGAEKPDQNPHQHIFSATALDDCSLNNTHMSLFVLAVARLF